MSLNRGFLFSMVLGASALAMTACGPTYPKCDNDENCAEHNEVCVNGVCTQCRDNSQCTGPGEQCTSGKCAKRPGYCDDSTPCPGNQKCRDNECGAECLDNSECSGNTWCRNGSCVEKPECGEGADTPTCPEGKDCVAGRCQVRVNSCHSNPVYFDFDSSSIKPNQKSVLSSVADCLKGNSGNIEIGGHCDERGTEEYNMALGERRAAAVRKYLTNLGVSSSKLSTRSYGEESPAQSGSNEAAWSKNRRAEFSPR